MSFFVWYTIRCGDIMLISLPTLWIWAILNVSISRFSSLFPHQARDDIHLPILSSFCKHVFPFYSVLTHAIGIGFQPRVCWAIRESTLKLQLSVSRSSEQSRRESTISLSRPSSRSSISQGSSDSESWDSTTDTKSESGLVIHAIPIPNYNEDYYVLNETLNVLAYNPQAKDSDDIYLAIEERGVESRAKTLLLVSNPQSSFKYIPVTFLPGDISGESPGKSSNLSFAARSASGN